MMTSSSIRRICLALIFGMTGTALGFGQEGGKEPVHAGKPLSQWIQALRSKDEEGIYAGLKAVTAMGPAAAPAVPALVQLLKEPAKNGFLHPEALRALAQIGPAAKPACPIVIELLFAENGPTVQAEAQHVLLRIGPGAIPYLVHPPAARDGTQRYPLFLLLRRIGPVAAQEILPLLKDKDPFLRYQAAHLLVGMGPEAKAAIPVLMDQLREADQNERYRAAEALEKIGLKAGTAVPALIQAAQNPAGTQDGESIEHAQMVAVRALGALGPAAKDAVPALTELLKHKSWWIISVAAEALGAIGPDARSAVPVLHRLLPGPGGRPEEGVSYARLATAKALWRLEGRPEPVVPVLIQLLKDQDRYVRKEAADALGQMGPKASAAGPELRQALAGKPVRQMEETELDMLISFADALGRVDPKAAVAVHFLVDALGDSSYRNREKATRALGRMGPRAREGIAALRRQLHAGEEPLSPDEWAMRLAAAEALWSINQRADEVLGVFAAVLDKVPANFCREAAGALGRMGPAAQAAVPTLASALNYEDSLDNAYDYTRYLESRAAPFDALGRIGPVAKAAVPALRGALADPDPGGRVHAAEALWRVSGRTDEAVPVLCAVLGERSGQMRLWAGETLGRMGAAAAAAVPALQKGLLDEYEDVRAQAATTLGAIGAAAKPAVPALVRALKDPDPAVCEAAGRALRQIDPEAARKAGVLKGYE
jgi:HEAT repeat protein